MTSSDPRVEGGWSGARVSILFPSPPRGAPGPEPSEPAFFRDLLLDQVAGALIRDREEFDLSSVLYRPFVSRETIAFRHEVWRDLESVDLRGGLVEFAKELREVRRRLEWSERSRYLQSQQGWHLDAARRYCAALAALAGRLGATAVSSRGLIGLREFLVDHVKGPPFTSLREESAVLTEELGRIRYCVNVRGNRVRVLRYGDEADYGAEIEETFRRFNQHEAKDYRKTYSDWPDMNHVLGSIADRVALLFPETFSSLKGFCERYRDFVDATVDAVDRELQFYLAYLEVIDPLRARGLPFCLPEVRRDTKEIVARDTFDLAMATKLVAEQRPVVLNDLRLEGPERIMIVSGPNQGGKTTFARTIGQLHYLAGLGCPVPGRAARLFHCDQIFTHFGREDDRSYESGKLEEDLLRARAMLAAATGDSVIIMNEIFSSTTVRDALVLGTRVIERVIELDALCVVVTFVEELTMLGPTVVSLTSTVNPANPVERTYKVVRRRADGLAYAIAIANKYGLTYEQLRERIG